MISVMLFLLIGLAFGMASAYAFRLLPDKWVCDYNETPAEVHSAANRMFKHTQIVFLGLLCGVCCVFAARTVNTSVIGALLCALLFAVLMLAAICDAKYEILPDELLAAAAVITLLMFALKLTSALYSSLYSPIIGAAVGFFGMWGFMLLASKIYKTEAMGFGDVKLMAVVGLLCGASGLAAAVVFAVLSAAIVFIVLLALKKRQSHDKFPFGPFIIAGAVFSICFRPEWLNAVQWYLSLF